MKIKGKFSLLQKMIFWIILITFFANVSLPVLAQEETDSVLQNQEEYVSLNEDDENTNIVDDVLAAPAESSELKIEENEQTATDESYLSNKELLENAVAIENVPPSQQLIEKTISEFKFSAISEDSIYGVRNTLNLMQEYNSGTAATFGGANVEWKSEPSGIIAADGTLTKTQQAQNVKLTAKITAKDDESLFAEKTFSLIVLPQGENFLYETFDNGSTASQNLNGYNGWKEVNSSKATYIDDTEITLEQGDASDNLLMQYKRTTVNDKSAILTASKFLEKRSGESMVKAPLERGIANIRFRFKRNDAARCLYVHLEDVDGYRETMRVNFDKNGLRPGDEAIFTDKIPFNSIPQKDVWLMAEITADYDRRIYSFSIYDEKNDSLELFENLKMANNAGNLASIAFGSTRSGTNKNGAIFLIDDVFVTQAKPPMTNKEAAEEVAEKISNSMNGSYVTENLKLSNHFEYETTVIWSSSNEDIIQVIGETGLVTPTDKEEKVNLTAAVVRGDVKAAKTFEVTVAPFSETVAPTKKLLNEALTLYTFREVTDESQYMITQDLSLPAEYNKGLAKRIGGVDISWKSSRPNVMTDEGKITPQKYDTYVTLTATFKAKENATISAKKTFKVCVAAKGEFVLKETFEEADFEKDMYKSVAETGIVSPGEVVKPVYKDWILTADSDTKPINTDTQVVYFPDDPYNTVLNYTRAQNNKTSPDVPVTFTKMEFGKEYTSGTLFISVNFYLTNNTSRLTIGPLLKDGSEGSAAFNLNYTRINSVVRPVATKQWHHMSIVIQLSESVEIPHRYDVFLDGERVNSNQTTYDTGMPVYGLMISSVRTSDGPNGSWYIDDLSIRHINYDVSDDIARAATRLELDMPSVVTADLDLPVEGENGTRISWQSSDEDVISSSGKISHGSGRGSATLTATVTKDSSFVKKVFPVSVSATLPAKPYSVVALEKADGKITGVQVRNNSFSEDCVLVTMLYSRGTLKEIRICDLTATEGTTETVLFDSAINTDIYYVGEIRSYVFDTSNNEIISDFHMEDIDR
ncbi:MAG: hypothetical protein II978_08255 [Clostridia bacterium]|nr:hypothetical protein [Clostridia bacterium]